MVAGSKVIACHISVLFTAVLGRKLQPNGYGIEANHSLPARRSTAPSFAPALRLREYNRVHDAGGKLAGQQAAHEARSPSGERDMSVMRAPSGK